MSASQAITARTPEVSAPSSTRIAFPNSSEPAAAIPTPTQASAIARVTSGPPIATLNSVPGESESRVIRATPPNIHRVMSEMPIPRRRATKAWPSSWRRIEAKKASALARASRYGSRSPLERSSMRR